MKSEDIELAVFSSILAIIVLILIIITVVVLVFFRNQGECNSDTDCGTGNVCVQAANGKICRPTPTTSNVQATSFLSSTNTVLNNNALNNVNSNLGFNNSLVNNQFDSTNNNQNNRVCPRDCDFKINSNTGGVFGEVNNRCCNVNNSSVGVNNNVGLNNNVGFNNSINNNNLGFNNNVGVNNNLGFNNSVNNNLGYNMNNNNLGLNNNVGFNVNNNVNNNNNRFNNSIRGAFNNNQVNSNVCTTGTCNLQQNNNMQQNNNLQNRQNNTTHRLTGQCSITDTDPFISGDRSGGDFFCSQLKQKRKVPREDISTDTTPSSSIVFAYSSDYDCDEDDEIQDVPNETPNTDVFNEYIDTEDDTRCKIIDVSEYGEYVMQAMDDGSIKMIGERGDYTYKTCNILPQRLVYYNNYLHALSNGMLYTLQTAVKETHYMWKRVTQYDNIIDLSVTHDESVMWIQLTDKGLIVNEDYGVIEEVSFPKSRRRVYGNDKNNYIDIYTGSLKVFPTGVTMTNVKSAILTYHNELVPLPSSMSHDYKEIRYVNWEPYYIKR